MMIGQLAARTGLSVRTLRFYADAGLLPEERRSDSGYRLFGTGAVHRGRLIRTLRDLGVGLDDIKRVLDAEVSLTELVAEHTRALDAQIRLLHLQRAVLKAFIRTSDPEELQQIADLTPLTAGERRRIVDDYLDAVFGDHPDAVAEKLSMGVPELPDDPTPEQLDAWLELAGLLRDPDFVAASRRMAERARAEGPEADVAQFAIGKAVGEIAGPAARAGVDPSSAEALAVVERLEAFSPEPLQERGAVAERIAAFTDRRVSRYWALVGVINGWEPTHAPEDIVDTWEWYGRALRAHS